MNDYALPLEAVTRIGVILDVFVLMFLTSLLTALVCRDFYKRE